MERSPKNPESNRFIHWIKNSITARMFIIGILSLILLIPLFMVQELIAERSERQKSVVAEINEKEEEKSSRGRSRRDCRRGEEAKEEEAIHVG